jgi:hypothetical protein
MSKRRRDPLVSIRRIKGRAEDDKEIRQTLFGEGWEALSDAVIDELVEKGWDREELLGFKELGCFYCRPRNSIVSPPVFGGF